MAEYAVLTKEIATWNRKKKDWDTIPAGTKGRIVDYLNTPLSTTYRLIFNEGKENCVFEYVNEKYLIKIIGE